MLSRGGHRHRYLLVLKLLRSGCLKASWSLEYVRVFRWRLDNQNIAISSRRFQGIQVDILAKEGYAVSSRNAVLGASAEY